MHISFDSNRLQLMHISFDSGWTNRLIYNIYIYQKRKLLWLLSCFGMFPNISRSKLVDCCLDDSISFCKL